MRLQAQGWLETSHARLQRRALIPRYSQDNANPQPRVRNMCSYTSGMDSRFRLQLYSAWQGKSSLQHCSATLLPLHSQSHLRTACSLPSTVSMALTLGHQL